MAYVKLHSSILDSSVWLEPHATRIVWITLMAMADQDGLVRARAPGITSRARVTRAECETALATFRAPDPDSATPDHEGRRIADTAEGVQILNYEMHRDRMDAAETAAKHAARQARYRARLAKKRDDESSTPASQISPRDAPVTHVTKVTHSAQLSSSAAHHHLISDASGEQRARTRVAPPMPESRMMDPPPDPAPDVGMRAEIMRLNRLCAEVTAWTGSLLDSDRNERTAAELIKRAQACAHERGVEPRWLLEAVMRKWWSPRRMLTRKSWVVMALQDWHETLAELDDEQERNERNNAGASP